MLTHGGDIAGYFDQYGCEPLDFSANVSPLGLPEGVRRAVIDSLSTADQYPDPLCRRLRAAIGAFEGVDPARILCGNGAADLIFRLVLAVKPKTALVPAPTFAEYETALESCGCAVTHAVLKREDDFRVTEEFLSHLDPAPDLVFLCQPNNPTGQPVDRALLETVLQRCESAGSILVLDECFVSLLDDGPSYTMKGRLDSPNLFLLKAFTKTYAMAGLRLGYCLCSKETLLQDMARCGQPWSVSTVAQAAGIAALQETAYVERLHQLIAAERPQLAAGLRDCGCTVLGSRANFVFFSARPGLDAALRQKGILIRSCANYHGLDETYYRVAVRTAPDNEKLLAAVSQCMEE